MAKVERRLIRDGDFYEISCAVRDDGTTSPASEVLDQLAEGMWEDDPDAEQLPDEYQPSLRQRLIAHIEHLADNGYLARGTYNRLNEGIWEIKVGVVRVSFFDTDGSGGVVPKLGERVPTWDQRGQYELPDFDEFVRLGHSFAKTGQRTTSEDLTQCTRVREEDVNHDKRS